MDLNFALNGSQSGAWIYLNLGPGWISTWALDGPHAGPCIDLKLGPEVALDLGPGLISILAFRGAQPGIWMDIWATQSGSWLNLNLGHGFQCGPCMEPNLGLDESPPGLPKRL